jgi:capsular polysaccharide biosynthesis protein
MGGSAGDFHRYIVAAILKMYGLSWDNFFFPKERILIELNGPFIFFSDQKLRPLHPAQMAHPRSVELLSTLKQHLPFQQRDCATKLFISRSDAKLRKIANEAELAAIAEQRGFEVTCLSALNMAHQFAIMRQAHRIVGAHGMGFTHIFLNDRPLSVLELFNPTQGTDAYAIISRALKFDYHFLIGDDLQDNRASYWVDPRAFARKLNAILE